MRGRDRQGGFTLMEIMVSLLVLVLGLLGVMALQMTTVKGNRASRTLDRAVDYVEQEMEDLRGTSTDKITTGATCIAGLPTSTSCEGTCSPCYPDLTSSDGITFKRSYAVTTITGQASLLLVTATVTYPDDEDNNITHTQQMVMLRTTQEKL